MIRTTVRTASLFATVLVASCSTAVQPQLTTFEYQRTPIAVADLAVLSAGLNSGSARLADLSARAGQSCQFSSSVGPFTGNDVDVNGDPNSQPANIVLDATNDLARPSNACPASVGYPPFTLHIETNNDILVGQPVIGSGTALVEIDGETFSSASLYLKFELTSYDGDYTTGDFEFIAKNIDDPADNRILVVHNGSFALDD